VLSGGPDIHPRHYGCEFAGHAVDVDERRDEFELALAMAMIERGKPVLGLCRGMELLAVVAGGKLLNDLSGHDAGGVGHWQSLSADRVHHPVELAGGSMAYDIYGTRSIEVNSAHHQGVEDAGRLVVTGVAPDGLPEVVEGTEYWAIGVQWHPEYLLRTRPETRRLFESLVSAAAAGR
jgi:putative glutamine amidotransferase